jgi:Ca2+-binding EF-hand superfamily protein
MNGNGRIERAELSSLIADLKSSFGVELTDDQITEVMNILDTDDDGTIDLAEFKQLIM